MKSLSPLLLLLLLVGCQVKGKTADGGIISGHIPASNKFTITTDLNRTYAEGESIDVVLSFPNNVTVTGTPEITLNIGGTNRIAPYIGGSGGNLIFSYIVMAGENDTDGISIGPAIDLNGGSIKYDITKDCNTSLTVPSLGSVKVDTIDPTLISVSAPTNNTYYQNQNLNFTASFTEAVVVFGSPRISLNIGGSIRQATYVSGSGSTQLVFRYTVNSSDSDNNGIAIASPVDLNGADIVDGAGNSSSLNFTPPNSTGVLVAGDNPVIVSMTPPSNGNYTAGNNLNFIANFNEAVTITGTPRLAITIGSTTKYANYLSGSGTSAIRFRYTVVGGDLDADGIVLASPVGLNGGTIRDGSLNNAILDFIAPGMSGVLVTTTAASITTINIPASIPTGGFDVGANVDFTAVFSDAMTVTGSTARLRLNVGGATKYAVYQSGSGTNNLVFRYVVAATEEDLNGLAIVSPLELNGSVIVDSGGLAPILTFTPPVSSTVIIDTVAPNLLSNTKPADGIYSSGQNLDFDVTFSEPVIIGGAPRLTLTVGSSTRYATYNSGSGSNVIKFRFTVGPTDNDNNGIVLNPSIDLNSGTIRDPKSHNSALTLVTTATSGIRIDNTAPTILSLTPPANSTYTIGQNLNFIANMSEAVTVSGSPRLEINIGGVARYADYLSGSGTSTLTFRYTVISADSDSDGIGTVSPIAFNGGTIRDMASVIANLNFTSPDTTGVLISGAGPTVLSVNLPANGKYSTGQTINLTVNYSQAVVVTLIPRIAITLGSGTVYANYSSGGGTSSLIFSYTVTAGDTDADGIVLVSPIDPNGGAIQDLSLSQNATLTFTLPDSSGITVDGLDPIITSVTAPANNTYRLAENLDFTVNYSSAVTVTGTPQISMVVGPSSVVASYISGSGTSALIFRYTIVLNDTDTTGVDISSPLLLNGGTIKDSFGDNATLTFTSPDTSEVKVDAIIPTISSVAPPAAASYYLGENIDFVVNFSENVNAVGSPRIPLTIGVMPKYAIYQSGSGTSALTFRYTVIAGDIDADGISSYSPIELNSGTLKDLAGNNLTPLTFTTPNTTGVNVDGTAPSITSLTPPANGTFKTTNNLNFVANFSKPVTVTGTPRLTLTVGASTLYANYLSGSGTANLNFRYTVAPGASDNNGIELTSSVDLNGGTIADSAAVNATLSFTAPDTSAVLVDGIDLVISSFTPPADKTYVVGENLDFTANFNYPAIITGSPRIQLTVGATTIYATYSSGSGTTAIVFRYTVAATHFDSDGISTISNIGLNGGTIRDIFADNADITFAGANYPNKKVDGNAPTIVSVTAPINGTYQNGDNLDFTVNYSENVNVTGAPRFGITVGVGTVYANYLSGSGTSAHVYRYTATGSDVDLDGITVLSPMLLNGGTIQDVPGNAVSPLTFTPPNTTGVIINGASPYILSVTAPANATYKTGNAINFTVTYSENVNIVGIPRIQLTVGVATVYASYLSGSGSNTLIFRYTVIAGDSDNNGIAMGNSIDLNGGTIKSDSTVNAQLNFTAPVVTGILIDGIDIVISSMTMPIDKTYKIGDNFDITVNYNYAAAVTGLPRIQMTVGAATLYATYTSGSGTTAHIFRYTVAVSELDTDGVTTISNIGLNGGTIRDAFNDNATLTFAGSNYPNKKVDGVRPTVSSNSVSANKTYIVGENINFTFTYSEPVTITGSPRLALTVGSSPLYADYLSGSGTSTIIFRYTVLAGDLDSNGIAVASTNIDLNAGTISDLAGNAQTNLAFTAPTLTGVLVDGIVPTITSITPPTSQTYGLNAQLNFIINFSEAVTITGSPYLSLNIGGASRNAVYVSGSGTSAITVRYTTVLNDSDTDGVASVSPVVLNGGTIKDSATNNATLIFTGTTHTGVLVDAVPPAISSVTPPAPASYQNGGTSTTMTFVVNYNEVVNVVGTPRLNLTIGSSTVYANYTSGTGTSSLTFTYAVLATQLDMNGVVFGNTSIDLNSATIRDAVLNNALLNMGAVDLSQVFVVFPSMFAWFDLSDSNAITTSGSNVTNLLDKIGSYDLTHTGAGVPYTSTGFNGGSSGFVTCNNTQYFNSNTNQSWKAVFSVMKAPISTSNQNLAWSGQTNRPMVQFSTTDRALIGDPGGHFTGSSFASGSTIAANFWTSSSGQYLMRAVQWDAPLNRSTRFCQFDGDLSEFIFFNVAPTPTQILAIEAQLSTKHGGLLLP